MSLPFKVYNFTSKNANILPRAAIIVLQEWWGVNDMIKQHAQNIADHTGAYTVIPDLYKGKVGVNAEEASHLMSKLDWNVAIGEIEQLIDNLNNQGYDRIGSIGFCMGGGLSFALAADAAKRGKPIQAAVGCYGTPPDHFDLSLIKDTAIQGHFGGKDKMAGFSDPAAADALETRLKNAKEVNIYRYPEQGHAFLNADTWGVNVRKELGFLEKDKDAIVEEKDIRDQAWGRIFNFFTKHLSS
ncbi:hypothetical protein G6F70_006525 [Rhizopus microsporus]|uniref:Dienelactone hydrolase domain-containing protein n=2 Tax=Rhizopus TaxID=4842 RepID=A0A367JP56_RHIAZ|nr:hypothetical protein G6F71_006425 [Rhizopus microsporus]RCH91649.1 hypothetical protein CU097_003172 [Rhizopus azygosporus]KAG1197551.1 hypothetical protein G6F70_006525 [Rhizopus microsporus]KAG1209338.1 hypothetical protein G6F69_006438 [Rhizopus microsporus]KAG1230785.1 hypothetical protein G6F67_006211 [Rhizopus microsporus]